MIAFSRKKFLQVIVICIPFLLIGVFFWGKNSILISLVNKNLLQPIIIAIIVLLVIGLFFIFRRKKPPVMVAGELKKSKPKKQTSLLTKIEAVAVIISTIITVAAYFDFYPADWLPKFGKNSIVNNSNKNYSALPLPDTSGIKNTSLSNSVKKTVENNFSGSNSSPVISNKTNNNTNTTPLPSTATSNSKTTQVVTFIDVSLNSWQSNPVWVGNTTSFAANLTDQNGNGMRSTGPLDWKSSNPAIATVDHTGVATGVAPGSVTITASYGSVSGSATLKIIAAPVVTIIDVSLNSWQSNPVWVGNTTSFAANITDQYGNGMKSPGLLVWTSSDPAIATVDHTGTSIGVAPGSTTITASYGSVSGSTTLKVIPAPVLTSINVSLNGWQPNPVSVGNTTTFSVNVNDQYGNGMKSPGPLVWTSSNPAIATVDHSGVATGVAPGSVTITASYGSVSGSATLKVVNK